MQGYCHTGVRSSSQSWFCSCHHRSPLQRRIASNSWMARGVTCGDGWRLIGVRFVGMASPSCLSCHTSKSARSNCKARQRSLAVRNYSAWGRPTEPAARGMSDRLDDFVGDAEPLQGSDDEAPSRKLMLEAWVILDDTALSDDALAVGLDHGRQRLGA